MATVMEQEVLTAGYTPPPMTAYTKIRTVERKLRPEERMDLTIEEAEALANGEPFELIDGRMVFKEEKYETRAPDLAIEIVSDDDRATAVFEKARMYLERAAGWCGLFFPPNKALWS